MNELQRIRLWIPEPADAYLLTLNTARGRIHWRVWAKLTAAWREQAKVEAEASVAQLELAGGRRVHIEALPVQGPGGTLADPGGHMPTLKACVDGLRDAAWLPDDSGAYVAAVTMFPPVRAAKDSGGGMVVDLTTMPATIPALF
ncbi:MAG: hypothetical protein WBS24_03390 [Terriglobales bacterium]